MHTSVLAGFGLGLSLIVAIGSQNAFVLRQGLRGEHIFWICLTCALSDALLMTLGITSLATVTRVLPGIEPVLRYGGALFLLVYGLRSAYSAWQGGQALEAEKAQERPLSLVRILGITMALTFLNPHVYLDTVVLVGSIASQHPGREAWFGIGAITASFTFFFALGYGARLLRPLFSNANTWRWLDALIALVMWSIAISLLIG